ncbi:DUF3667 domain-containing protein [Winogradskyella litorisediminis]|uniref:DUF3667 domain-containing protein n=1 Tax=Winogradskyella litorisediminis TaxID=1156618 RepID=A0ABW3N8K7_9FLAO
MNCKNCKQELSETSDYCNKCGGRVVRNRLTFKNLFEHITETFFNFDNKLLRTFIALFKTPEDVIVSYIKGVRKRYVNPISYLALTLTVGGLYIIVLNKFFPDAMAEMSNPYSINQAQQEAIKESVGYTQEYYSIVMVLFIPLYALFSRIVFIGKKEFNYTEQIVMAMYIIAQFSLISSFLNLIALSSGVSSQLLGFVSIFAQIGYFAYCYKRIYKLDFGGILLRTLIFFGIIGAIMVGFIILGVIVFLVFRDSPMVESFMESQRAVYEKTQTIKDSIN